VEFIRIPDVGTGSQELVVTGGVNGHVSCWNSGTGAHIATLSGHTSMIVHLVTAVDLTTGVNTLIAADTNGAIRAWDPCGSWSLRWEVPTAHGKAVRSLNARDKHVISGSADGTVKVWEVATGHLVKQVGDTGSGRAIYNVAFNEDGQAGINVVLGEGGDTVFEVRCCCCVNLAPYLLQPRSFPSNRAAIKTDVCPSYPQTFEKRPL